MSDRHLAIHEANMHEALRSWHSKGGDTRDPGMVEMPFDELIQVEADAGDDLAKERKEAHAEWLRLQAIASDLASRKLPYASAQQAADEYYDEHAEKIAAFIEPCVDDRCGAYEWKQRALGARMVFRWILAEGYHPLKIMKRLWAVGRAMNLEPFTRLTITEQGLMFSETKAACSWRMKVLSGLIKLAGMAGHRLPGQKTDRAVEAARKAATGNRHRANSVRQRSFLRKLHVTPGKPGTARRGTSNPQHSTSNPQ